MLLGRWLKVRNWWDPIDPHVIVGAFPFARDVKKMAALGVKGIVNTCDEYPGPIAEYEKFGIEQFHMPTIDFTHPSLDDVTRAVEFIEEKVSNNETVYIHCKAGRARSATVAICWLMKAKGMSPKQGQSHLLDCRPHVNAKLTTRPVVKEFAARLTR